MKSVTGETLRPGGLQLTKRAAELLAVFPGTRILDSGCGMGSTMEFLNREYRADVTGIDPSPLMVEAALKKGKSIKTVSGLSENVPFEDESFDIVFSECCLSHSESISASLKEFYRVLLRKGSFVLCDLYIKNQNKKELIGKKHADSGILTEEEIKSLIAEAGFKIILFEDHTWYLGQLAGEIIFKYGSMKDFLDSAAAEGCDCMYQKPEDISLGYYLLIAERKN
ncbi:MAG: methyltransferase domain-containing protein [Spirochaetes bacterium]|nr:methyltransferase domain-containing protein [Spirochaetota bacterium]